MRRPPEAIDDMVAVSRTLPRAAVWLAVGGFPLGYVFGVFVFAAAPILALGTTSAAVLQGVKRRHHPCSRPGLGPMPVGQGWASSVRRWRTSRPAQGPPFVRLSTRVVKYRRTDVDGWLVSRRIDPEAA
jgi:hypothetical protein